MTQIFTGEGLGLHGSSLGQLGGYGPAGVAGLGQGGSSIHVNVANGNMVLRQQDGFLADEGFGLGLFQTYNSRGGNAGNWVFNIQTALFFQGTPQTEGSVVERLDEDGHRSRFIFDTGSGRYLPQDGSTATLRYVHGAWEYSEGNAKVFSQYNDQGQLISLHDEDGHHFAFSYQDGILSQITDTSGRQKMVWVFDEGRLKTISMESEGTLIHRIEYEYDAQGRLKTLSRGNLQQVFQVTYRYDGDSNRISALEQSDGVCCYFEYEGEKLVAIRDGEGGVTRYRYHPGYTEVILPSGEVWTYHYDEKARLTEVNGPSQYRLRYHYENNRLSSITQGSLQWFFHYNAAGDCERIIEPSGKIILRTYDSHHRLLKEQHQTPFDGNTRPAQSQTTHCIYDDSGHLRFYVEADGTVRENRYNSQGLLQETRIWTQARYPGNPADILTLQDLETWVSRQNPQAVNLVGYQYDWRGQCTGIIQYNAVNEQGEGLKENALVTLTQYDAAGRLISKSVPTQNGLATTFYFYDHLGRLERIIDPLGQVRRIEYDDSHQRIVETDAAGLQTITLMDARGQVISVHKLTADQDFGTTTYTLDAQGNRICETDASGQRRWYFYNELQQLQGTVTADGQLTLFTYDQYGKLIQTRVCREVLDVRDWGSVVASLENQIPKNHPEDRITRQIYDSRGFLKATVDAEGGVIVYTFNAAGQILEKRALANKLTKYDPAMPLIGEAWLPPYQSEDRCMHYYYDSANRLQAMVNGEGYATQYQYNAAGQLIETIRHFKPISQYTGIWEADAPPVSRQDIHAHTLYNAAGLKVGEIDGEGYLIEYGYDESGLLSETRSWYNPVSLSGEKPWTLENLRPIPHDRDQYTRYRYNAAGLCTEIRQHQGLVTFYTYDEMGRVIAITRQDINTGILRRECNRYDASGRIIAQLDAKGAELLQAENLDAAAVETIWKQHGIHFTYDLANRIKTKTSALGETTHYFYNEAGLPVYTIAADGGVTETRYNAFQQIASVLRYSTPLSESAQVHTFESLQKHMQTLKNPRSDQILHYTYNHAGQIESISSATHTTKIFKHNAFGELEDSIEILNESEALTLRHQYDRRGLLTDRVRDPDKLALLSSSNRYDPFGRLQETRDARLNGLNYQYDKCGRILFVTRNNQEYRALSWDAFGRLLTESDWGGSRSVSWQYQDNAFSMIASDGQCLSITQNNAFGDTIAITDAAGRITRHFYDEKGQRIRTEGPEDTWKKYQYDAAGHLVWQEDAQGHAIAYTLDAMGRILTETRDPQGLALVRTYTFDALGRQLCMQDAAGQVQIFSYNPEGLLDSVCIDPDGLKLLTTFTYDDAGRLLRKTIHNAQGENRVTAYVWDIAGRRIATIEDPDHLALSTRYFYDAADNVIRVTDARGYDTHYLYDSNNQCRYYVDSCGVVTESRYDANGNNTHTIKYAQRLLLGNIPETLDAMQKMLREDREDQWQFRIFDDRKRLVVLFDAGGYATSYAYDLAGNPRKSLCFAHARAIADLKQGNYSLPSEELELSRQTFYVHDDLNRLRYTVDSLGYVRERVWDKSGLCTATIAYAHRLNSFQDASSQQALKAALRPDSQRDQTVCYEYDPAGRLCFQRSAEGSVTAWIYDGADRVLATRVYAHKLNGEKNIPGNFVAFIEPHAEDRITHTLYDAAGRVAYKISSEGAVREYSYDDTGNLTREKAYASRITAREMTLQSLKHFCDRQTVATENRSTVYRHDAAGRMTQSVDALGKNTVYEYDGTGNIRQKTEAGGAVWLYGYDAANRLVESRSPATAISRRNASGQYVQTNSTLVTRLIHDSFGNIKTRIEDAEGEAQTTHFLYDTRNNLCEIQYPSLGIYAASAYASSERQESIQRLFEQRTWNAFGEQIASKDRGGNWRYFARDNVGRVGFTLDASGALTEQRYDAFGNCVMSIAHAQRLIAVPDDRSLHGFAKAALYTEADRQTWMEYDRDNRLSAKTRDAERSYNPLTLQYEWGTVPETRMTYDAFGQVVTKAVRLNSKDWALSRFYYDGDGQVRAELNALGYLTTRNWNVFGECEEEIQYAKSTQATASSFLIPERSSEDRHVVYQYDAKGQLIRKTHKQVQYEKPDGPSYISVKDDLSTQYVWDAMGNMIWMQDAAGYETHMYYDAWGQMTAKIGPKNQKHTHAAITYAYNAQGQLTETHHWAEGAARANTYDYILNAQGEKDIVTQNHYDAAGQLISTVDGMNHALYFSYDANGNRARQWEVVHQWGETILRDKRYTYDAEGRLVQTLTFKNGGDYLTEDCSYNTFGELTAKGINKQFQIHMDYDRSGRVWRSNARGHYELYVYNLADQVTQIITSSNTGNYDVDLSSSVFEKAIRFDEGAWAQALLRQDNLSDALGRMIFQRKWLEDEALNLKEINQTWRYDRFGNMIFHRNAEGFETIYTWNAFDVLSSKTLPEVDMENEQGQTLRIRPVQWFACDALGRVTGMINANGNIIHKRYDAYGQLIEEIDAKGHATSRVYDLHGQLISTTNARGAVTLYTYDKAKRLIAVNNAGNEQRYTLDEAGQMLLWQHGSADSMRYWYDTRGNLVQKRDARNFDTHYAYDDEGHKIAEQDALKNTQSWVYENGLLKSHTDLGHHTTTYSHNVNGLVVDEISTRGRNLHYRYTADGKLRQFEDKAHRETVNFTYDAEGRIKTREGGRVASGTDGWIREQETYAYDALGRLVSMERRLPDENTQDYANALRATYTYDAVGNIRHTKVIAQRKGHEAAMTDDYYTYDANNRLLINKGSLVNGQIAMTNAQGTTLSYDAVGNIATARKYEDQAEQVWKYAYNANNQVELIEKNNKRVQVKTYDQIGRIKQEIVFNSNNLVDKTHNMHWEQGLLAGSTLLNDQGRELSRETLEYDAVGNRTKSVQRVHAQLFQPGSTMTHRYGYDANYQQTRDECWFVGDDGSTTNGLSTRVYDVNGQLQDVIDQKSNAVQENNTTHYWFSSLDGLRSKQDKTGQTHYLNLGGKTIGDIHYSYTGSTRMQVHAGFTPSGAQDNSMESQRAELPEMPQGHPGEYVIQGNDSLEQIAFQVYGDSSLWYILADANGITDKNAQAGSQGSLHIGQRLMVPSVAIGQHHTNDTYRIMDSNQMTGDTSPTWGVPQLSPVPVPVPRKKSLLAKIVVAVVSMVATVLTAGVFGALAGVSSTTLGGLISTGFKLLAGELTGASLTGLSMGFAAGFAGSIAGQSIANLFGIQKGLDLKSSLINGLSSAVGMGILPVPEGMKETLKSLSFKDMNLVTAAQMMQSDAINQGLNMALSKQARFNWAELLSTGLTGGILGGEKAQKINNYLHNQHGPLGKVLNNELQALAYGSTQSLLSGQKPNPTQILENNLGPAIGNTLLQSLPPQDFINQDDLYLSDNLLDILHPERTSEAVYALYLRQQAAAAASKMKQEGVYREYEFSAIPEEGNFTQVPEGVYGGLNNVDNVSEISRGEDVISGIIPKNIDTASISELSLQNNLIKLSYEGYKKQEVKDILNKAGNLHNQKISKLTTSLDLKKMQQIFNIPTSQSWQAIQNGRDFFGYKLMGNLGNALNVLYVGGEAYNAHVNSENSLKNREITAATVGASAEIGVNIVLGHYAGVGVAWALAPILPAIPAYVMGASALNIIYSSSLGNKVKNFSTQLISSSWDRINKVDSKVNWAAVYWCNKY